MACSYIYYYYLFILSELEECQILFYYLYFTFEHHNYHTIITFRSIVLKITFLLKITKCKKLNNIYICVCVFRGVGTIFVLGGGAIYFYVILYILLFIINIITNYILLISYTYLVYVNPLIFNLIFNLYNNE